jgi:hypothetical protein
MSSSGLMAAWVVASTLVCGPGGQVPDGYSALRDAEPQRNVVKMWSAAVGAVCPVCAGDACAQIHLFENPGVAAVTGFGRAEGPAKVVYSPRFVSRLHHDDGWGGPHGLMVHHIARLLELRGAAPDWLPKEWAPESRADALTGCGLARMALHPKVLARSLRALRDAPPCGDAPWAERLRHLKWGWARCGEGELPVPEALPTSRAWRCRTATQVCANRTGRAAGAACRCGDETGAAEL